MAYRLLGLRCFVSRFQALGRRLQILGYGLSGLEFRIYALWGLRFGSRLYGLGFRV